MLKVQPGILFVLCCYLAAHPQETTATCKMRSADGRIRSSNSDSFLREQRFVHVTAKRLGTNGESRELRTAAGAALAATTVTQRIQIADNRYTVIEYPAKKEVTVTLNPVTIGEAKGVASILRDDDGTRIKLNLTNLPADLSDLTLYAVDRAGTVTALGPITISNGVGTLSTITPLTTFMLIVSPQAWLTAYDTQTRVVLRSVVPEGFTVIPLASVGEKVAAMSPAASRATAVATLPIPTSTQTTYNAPMLNIPNFKSGDDTKVKATPTGPLTGARANVFIVPRKDGPTEVRVRFHDLKAAPAGQKFILWAMTPDNLFVKLAEIVYTRGLNPTEIRSKTTLPDFGLVVTMESSDGPTPAGPSVVAFHIIP